MRLTREHLEQLARNNPNVEAALFEHDQQNRARGERLEALGSVAMPQIIAPLPDVFNLVVSGKIPITNHLYASVIMPIKGRKESGAGMFVANIRDVYAALAKLGLVIRRVPKDNGEKRAMVAQLQSQLSKQGWSKSGIQTFWSVQVHVYYTWFTLEGGVQKSDADGRLKILLDALALATELDDSCFWQVSVRKKHDRYNHRAVIRMKRMQGSDVYE